MGQINLAPGNWLYVNCGDIPSERNCKLVIQAPADQREDLLDAAVAHAVKSHGHDDTPQLREEIDSMLNAMTV